MPSPPISGRYVEVHFLDANDEVSVFEFRVGDTLDISVSFTLELFGDLCNGRIVAIVQVDRTALDTDVGQAPTSQLIQGSIRWQVDYTDDVTGQIGHMFIPTADLSILPSGSEQLPLNQVPGEDFKQAFDDAALSPDGNGITIQNIEFAG